VNLLPTGRYTRPWRWNRLFNLEIEKTRVKKHLNHTIAAIMQTTVVFTSQLCLPLS